MNSQNSRHPVFRALAWVGASLLALAIVGGVGAKLWLESYLRSARFRQTIGEATAGTFKTEGGYMPFHFNGTTIYTDGYEGRGTEAAFFSSLRVGEINADFDLRGVFDHVWRIDQLDIGRLDMRAEAGEPRAAVPAGETGMRRWMPAFSWLPRQVDLRRMSVRDANFHWTDVVGRSGAVDGAALTITPDAGSDADAERGWNIEANGGTVSESGLPNLEVSTLKLRYRRPSLFITDARLRRGPEGSVTISGEVNFQESMDLHFKLAGLPVDEFIRPDWRQRLKGELSGDVEMRGNLPLSNPPLLKGALTLTNGELQALPILNQIAQFTDTPRFQRMELSQASASFAQTGETLHVSNIIVECEGLLRVEGDATVTNGNVEGQFQIGVTASSLQWLPGSRDRVFKTAREGYLWTTLRVTGPLDHPTEDLSPRLAAAAQGAIIEGVQGAVNGAVDGVENRVLDILKPLSAP